MNNRCVGCGVILQNTDINKEGYVSSKDFSLCERCFRIKYYNENKRVNNRNINFFDKINNNDYVVYVSSLLTINLKYIDRFKNVILVLTKRDIIPKSFKDNKIISYIRDHYNINDIIIVSANRKYNLDVLYNRLSKIEKNKKIYFVGSTNSGKSTLINSLSYSYGNKDGLITTSAFPNTTMDILKVKINDLVIYDTPGIVNDNSIINVLDNRELKTINSKKEIKPITFQISGSGSIIVSDLFRLDYETDVSSLTFYMSNNIDIKRISLKNELFSKSKEKYFNNVNNKDIVIEDIGYIMVTNSSNIVIRYNSVIDISIRDNLV